MENTFFPDNLDAETGIFFHSEQIAYELKATKKIQDWLTKIIEQEEQTLSLLNFIFCSDEYLHHINLEYLHHDTYTDIITFPFAELPKIEGEIYISIDRVRDNAKKFETHFEDELLRVLAHGVLHLCGYPDKTAEEAKLMRQKEEEALALFTAILN